MTTSDLGSRLPAVEVVGLGEPLVQFQTVDATPIQDGGALLPRIAGAELNVCATLQRFGVATAFHSRVGADAWGHFARDRIAALGIDVAGITTDPVAQTGLMFKEPAIGDARPVIYWRAGSAASRLGPADGRMVGLRAPALLVVSGITLAIGPGPVAAVESAVDAVLAAGGLVAFDPNLRAPLGGADAIRSSVKALLPRCSFVLGGLDEVAELLDVEAAPAAALAAVRELTAAETVLKDGERGAWVPSEDEPVLVPAVQVEAVDTVGAGDAFVGAYLAARLRGSTPRRAAMLGAEIAAGVVGAVGDHEGLPDADTAKTTLRRHLDMS